VVELPFENGSKDLPEQRAHTNNNGEPSLQDVAEHLRDRDDDFSVDRKNNNDAPPAQAPGADTDGETADPNDVLLHNRSGDGSRQGQGSDRRSSLPLDLPRKVEKPPVKRSASVLNPLNTAGRQRKFGLGNSQFCTSHVCSAVPPPCFYILLNQ